MKRILLVLNLLLIVIGKNVFGQYEIKLSEELYITKLSDKISVVTHYFPWHSNSLIVKASVKEVVLIDTPYETEATALMINWIIETLKPKKITAINTGFHVDNLGGNQYLREKSIDIYGSDRTCQLLDERGEKTRQHLISEFKPGQESLIKTYELMTFVKPNKIFEIEKGLELKMGNLTFEVFFPGETHSPDNLVVYVKELELLFGGCMIKSLSSVNLGYTADANMMEWPSSLEKLQKRFDKTKLVIPHHGMWGDSSLIDHTLNLLSKNKI